MGFLWSTLSVILFLLVPECADIGASFTLGRDELVTLAEDLATVCGVELFIFYSSCSSVFCCCIRISCCSCCF